MKTVNDESSSADEDTIVLTVADLPPMDALISEGRVTTVPKPCADTVIAIPPVQGESIGAKTGGGTLIVMLERTEIDPSVTARDAENPMPFGERGGLM